MTAALLNSNNVILEVLCALTNTRAENSTCMKLEPLFQAVEGVEIKFTQTFNKEMVLRVLCSGTFDLVVLGESFGLSLDEVLEVREKTGIPILYLANDGSSACSQKGVISVPFSPEEELRKSIGNSVQNALAWGLENQVAYEQLLSKILSAFIDLDVSDINSEVMKALESIGSFFRVDRVHVWTFEQEGTVMEKSFNWTASGINYHFEVGRQIPVSMYSWIVQQIKKKEIVSIASASELPLFAIEDRTLFKSVNTKSFLAVPMVSAGSVKGFIGFSSVVEERDWAQKTVELLETVSRVFVTFFEKRRAEKALVSSQKQFGNVVEHLSDGLIITDVDSKVVYANSRFLEICSLTEKEVLGEFPEQILGVSVEENILPKRFKFILKDKKKIFLELRVSYIRHRSKDSQYMILTVSDVTSQLVLEEELQHSKKMEAVGLLAGGIAHDFNNLLTAVLGYSGLLLGRLPDASPYRNELLQIKKASEQAGSLVEQLLTFSRKQVLVPKILNVNSIIRDTSKMLRRTIGKHIDVELSLDKSLLNVKVDATHIQQIVLNLVINARDAMPDGGCLKINSSMLCLTEEVDDLAVGTYVQFCVQDNGCGISPEIKEQIFDPFFTTKTQSKGTGLGLSTVYGAVKQNGGHIFVESEQEVGTTFRILLPAYEEKVHVAKSALEPEVLIGGEETILLVEDERGVRRLLKQVLEEKGYRVLSAKNGKEAVKKSELFNSQISLIISDVAMPVMGGFEAVEAIALQRPKIKVLYISGYRNKHKESQASCFLQKPFSPNTLIKKVREVLDVENPQMLNLEHLSKQRLEKK